MIDVHNLLSLFKELESELKKINEFREITLYGGAALISMQLTDRATVDIDVFTPKIDKVFERIISKIAKKYLFDERWINSTGAAFIKELPEGWENRVQLIYEGVNLKVNILGRQDLLFTKIIAELDRQEDLADILSLKPTPKELAKIKEPLLKLENDENWHSKVVQLIDDLKGAIDGK